MSNVFSATLTGITDGSFVNDLNKIDLVMTATVKDSSNSNVNADAIEAYLLQDGSSVKSYAATNVSTGVYTFVVPAEDMKPGTVEILVRAITEVDPNGNPANHTPLAQASVKSGKLFVTRASQIVEQDAESPIWKKITVTGAAIKAASGANSGAAKTVNLFDLPSSSGMMMLGAAMQVNTADAGAASTATASLGTNSSSFNDLLAATSFRSTGETDESASFVPKFAASGFVKTVITVTGSGKTIADIDDAASFDFFFGFVQPFSK